MDTPIAREALERIAPLYAIEAELNGKTPEERLAARGARSAPILAELRTWLEASLRRIPGRSDLAGAIRYTLSRWTALTLVLRDGRACLSNNAAEQRMRPVALGRKNYNFVGSVEGGTRAAVFYTLLETAEMNGWDPEAYLRTLLGRIADQPHQPRRRSRTLEAAARYNLNHVKPPRPQSSAYAYGSTGRQSG